MTSPYITVMMTETDFETPHRRSIRLKGWDYSGEGWYFVSLVAFCRECLFGVMHAGEMRVNALGQIVIECWEAIPAHFPDVTLDALLVMPNHVHGIIVIRDEANLPIVGAWSAAEAVPVGARHASPLQEPGQEPRRPHGVAPGSLGAMIGSFKSSVSRRAGRELNSANIWQRIYYEHIIRNDRELEAIRNYIETNPEKWAEDSENPSSCRGDAHRTRRVCLACGCVARWCVVHACVACGCSVEACRGETCLAPTKNGKIWTESLPSGKISRLWIGKLLEEASG